MADKSLIMLSSVIFQLSSLLVPAFVFHSIVVPPVGGFRSSENHCAAFASFTSIIDLLIENDYLNNQKQNFD
jgi:hypothetical protein